MVQVQQFEGNYGEDITRLILNIQQNEFGMPITIEDQKDLLNIEGFYKKNNGNFWIALSEGELIGTIALIDIGNGEGALRKMFVQQNFRGAEYGVALKLLTTLFDWAKQKKYNAIYLGTAGSLKAAHRFYEKNGFILLPKENLPGSFPLMQVDTRFYMYRIQ